MPEAVSHHLLDPTLHALVLIDQQPREARYRTVYDDGSEGETTHMLYWEDGEVRSMPVEEYPATRSRAVALAFDALIGRKVEELPAAAVEFLRMIGAVDQDGAVRKP